MPDLLLLRHAKSRWDEPALGDHDRDLAPRGEKAARLMGRLLEREGLVPDLVLCSTARRAVRTLDLVVAELGAAPAVKQLKSLYRAAPSRLLDVIQRQDDAVRRLLVVGHNPGLHELVLRLVGSGDAALRAELIAKLPTSALARLDFAGAGWQAVVPGGGRLVGFWRPRDLG